MPEGDTVQYHVTLCSPLRIKMGAPWVPVLVFAFDATMTYDGPGFPDTWAFSAVAVYVRNQDVIVPRKIRIQLIVPFRNVAGLVPQPFDQR